MKREKILTSPISQVKASFLYKGRQQFE